MTEICVITSTAEHNDKGKAVIKKSKQDFVTINGKLIIVDGSDVVPHKSGKHLKAKVIASAFVTIEDKKILLKNDKTTCGARLVSGHEYVEVK